MPELRRGRRESRPKARKAAWTQANRPIQTDFNPLETKILNKLAAAMRISTSF